LSNRKIESGLSRSRGDQFLASVHGGHEFQIARKNNEFDVYYRDSLTRSIVFLGKVVERRKKERVNNFKDLLKKAIIDFSGQVKDPSRIFLLGT
jgi:hypothetical protein